MTCNLDVPTYTYIHVNSNYITINFIMFFLNYNRINKIQYEELLWVKEMK